MKVAVAAELAVGLAVAALVGVALRPGPAPPEHLDLPPLSLRPQWLNLLPERKPPASRWPPQPSSDAGRLHSPDAWVQACMLFYEEQTIAEHPPPDHSPFARLSRARLRRLLDRRADPMHPGSHFTVAFVLAYHGVDVYRHMERMTRIAGGSSRDAGPAVLAWADGIDERLPGCWRYVYQRHPDDDVLRLILNARNDGAGKTAQDATIHALFVAAPRHVARVAAESRRMLEHLRGSFDEQPEPGLLLGLVRGHDRRASAAARRLLADIRSGRAGAGGRACRTLE